MNDNNSYKLGKILLWIIAAYHVATGAMVIWSGDVSIRFAKLSYGWTVEGSPELGILGELLGCYAIAFGLMMAVAARDPVAYRSFITVGIVLVALRLVQRAWFAAKIMEVFEVSAGRHWAAFVFILLIGAALALFRFQIHRRTGEP